MEIHRLESGKLTFILLLASAKCALKKPTYPPQFALNQLLQFSLFAAGAERPPRKLAQQNHFPEPDGRGVLRGTETLPVQRWETNIILPLSSPPPCTFTLNLEGLGFITLGLLGQWKKSLKSAAETALKLSTPWLFREVQVLFFDSCFWRAAALCSPPP